jgi:hypothetical protein
MADIAMTLIRDTDFSIALGIVLLVSAGALIMLCNVIYFAAKLSILI